MVSKDFMMLDIAECGRCSVAYEVCCGVVCILALHSVVNKESSHTTRRQGELSMTNACKAYHMHLAIARNDGATGGSNVFPGNPVRDTFPCNGRVSPCKMIGGQDAEETSSLRIRCDRSSHPHRATPKLCLAWMVYVEHVSR